MIANFQFDRKALTEFETFMTRIKQEEIHKAYARGLRMLGAGAVRHVKRQLANHEECKEMLEAGIDFDPKKAKRIEKLNPPRIAIGAISRKKQRANDRLKPPLGKPFIAHRLRTPHRRGKSYHIVEKHGVFLLQRFGEERIAPWTKGQYRQRLHLITAAKNLDELGDKLYSRQLFFNTVDEFVTANHDRIFERQLQQAIERG